MACRNGRKMKLEFLYPVWLILCTATGAALGHFTGYGTLRGLSDGVIVAMMPLFLLMLSLGIASLWRPLLPPCRCGKCSGRKYRLARQAGDTPQAIRFRCPECGRVYESSRGRFDEVADDGRLLPFLHHSKWGRWKASVAGVAREAPRDTAPAAPAPPARAGRQ